ncbi:hypothetical protein B0H19DRAFT_1264820 [Mycena capillaripes]|nr:hypothetical protein B0H19DRAFT_1264820 [Mycena capillaripes]
MDASPMPCKLAVSRHIADDFGADINTVLDQAMETALGDALETPELMDQAVGCVLNTTNTASGATGANVSTAAIYGSTTCKATKISAAGVTQTRLGMWACGVEGVNPEAMRYTEFLLDVSTTFSILCGLYAQSLPEGDEPSERTIICTLCPYGAGDLLANCPSAWGIMLA